MKVLLSKVSVLGVAAMLSMSVAQAQRGGHGQGHSGQYGQGQPGKISHKVQKYMSQGDKINIARAIGQKLGYKEKVVALSVFAQASSRNSKMVLISNGQKIGSVSLGMYSSSKTIYMPTSANINSLKLVMKGSAYVQKIVAATIKKTYQAPSRVQTLKARVNIQTSRYGQTLPIKTLVKQSTGVKLGNKKIKAVVVKAQSLSQNRRGRRGQSPVMAQVLVNGYPVGAPVYLSPYTSTQTISLQGVRTKNSTIKLQISGKALVQMVGLKVK